MSGPIEPVDWRQSADELHERYRAERDLEARKRLGALWLVRRGGRARVVPPGAWAWAGAR
jgi:hypothetical protein